MELSGLINRLKQIRLFEILNIYMPLYLVLIYVFTSLMTFSLGLLILKSDSKNPIHRSYFAFAFFILLWIWTLFGGLYWGMTDESLHSLISFRSAYAVSVLFPFFLTLFFYYFPVKTLKIPKWISYPIVLLTPLVFALTAFTPWVQKIEAAQDGLGAYTEVFGPLYGVYSSYLLLHLLLAVGLASYKLYKTRGGQFRKTLIASLGLFLFYFLGFLVNVILPAYDIWILQAEVVAFTLFFLIPTFYAVQKYRFFRFSYLSLKLLRLAVWGAAFIVPLLLSRFILLELGFEVGTELSFLTSAVIGLFSFILAWAYFPEILPRSFREFKGALEELHILLIYYCDSYERFYVALERIFILKLHVSQVKVFLVSEKNLESINIPLYKKNRFTSLIEEKQPTILHLETLKGEPVLEKGLLELKASLCLPLYVKEKLLGLIVLGKKSNQSTYSQEEVQELLKLKEDLQRTFVNILLNSPNLSEVELIQDVIEDSTSLLREENLQIQEVLKQQSDFMAVTAHEFRTPLNIALLQLEDTLEGFQSDAQTTEEIKIVESSLQQLKELSHKLFDVQQYDLNKVKLELADLKFVSFFFDIYQRFQGLMNEKEIDFKFVNLLSSQDPSFQGDRTQLRQVIHNLLSNAYKFTPEKGSVQIELSEMKGMYCLAIEDNGAGVPNESKERIFNRFQSGELNAGLGMGLYISRKIMELHGGSIHVEDASGGGARFILCLKI
jgi:signal transduction histidine kinase